MSEELMLPAARWYEVIHCWTDPGDCNEDHPVEKKFGVFPTREEAESVTKDKGLVMMSDEEYEAFHARINGTSKGCRINEHLVVFLGESRTIGQIVGGKTLELTSAKEDRRKEIFERAASAGIPAEAVDLKKIDPTLVEA